MTDFRGALAIALAIISWPAAAQSSACTFPEQAIPADTIVIAAGQYSGRKLDFQIDQSGHAATRFDVKVHADRPVALLLGAYEPAIWSISWTGGTRIVAVFATGYHRQVLAGLAPDTPVITSDHEGQGACGSNHVDEEGGLGWLNPTARIAFGRAVHRVYTKADQGVFRIAESARPKTAYASSPERPPASYRDRGAALAGTPGLDDAVKRGLIRPATPADIEMVRVHYRALAAASPQGVDIPPVAGKAPGAPPPLRIPRLSLHRGYVVLKPFVFPAGLYGAHSASFIVPRGVAAPGGKPGHSIVVDLNRATPCSGPGCEH